MDNSCSTVKVGDFGLSRESSSDEKMAQKTEIVQVQKRRDTREDHTAGVGTRSYASPEQMNGSDYDSSTDVYSLGIMLFELLYPMSTSMERQKCLSRLRERTVPEDWENAVGKAFPSMQDLLICMLSGNPSDRPTADSVARHVQNVLGEFTILSLDKHHYNNIPDMVLLRIEAEHRDNALQHTMQLIRDESIAADAPVDIVQYGMRSSSTSAAGNDKPAAIMEFALRYSSSVAEGRASHHRSASDLVRKLEGRAEIYTARQVSGASSTQS